jgi:translocation and assembly module TamB
MSVSGQAAVAGGSLFVEALGVPLTDIQARVSLAEQRIRVDTFVVRSGGLAQLSGVIGVADAERPDVQLNATFQDFRAVNRPDLADLTASGRLALVGRLPDAAVTGNVTVNRGRITIPRLTDERELEIVDAGVGQLGADTIPAGADVAVSPFGPFRIEGLDLVLGDDVWAQNPDVRVQIDGSLQVYSAGGEIPRVFGRLRTVRGTYDFRIQQIVREFEVEQGTIDFFGTPELNPGLDIVAVNEVRTGGLSDETIRILVRVGGTLEAPDIDLSSDTRPPLPESELLSLLVFGQPSVGLGGLPGRLAQQLLFQEIIGGQLTAGLERLVTSLNLGPLAPDYIRFRARPTTSFNNLDRGVVGSTLGTTTLEAGKQLVNNVFLTVEAGIGALFAEESRQPTFGAGLEWQIDDQWSVRAALEPVRRSLLSRILQPDIRYQQSLDVRRRWEFGRAREDAGVIRRGAPQARLSGAAAPPLPAEEPEEEGPR